jgi:glycosyltransferase involved in cell wall biosynthesis
VPPRRPDALARTLQRVIENPAAWHGFAAAGHARYTALFSEEVAAAAIASVVAGKLVAPVAPPAREGLLASVQVHR